MKLPRVVLFALSALVATLAFSTVGRADVILGTEDPVSGFVGTYLPGAPDGALYQAASDGEVTFDPFNAGFDTSDGVTFAAGFGWAPGNAATAASWVPVVDPTGATDIWVLPAVNENEPTFETPGYFISPIPWNVPPVMLGNHIILDWPGDPDFIFQPGWSDVIVLANTQINGAVFATLTFYSDFVTPEPSTLAIFSLGGVALAALRLRRKSA
jgi:PEP-CTERM motif